MVHGGRDGDTYIRTCTYNAPDVNKMNKQKILEHRDTQT